MAKVESSVGAVEISGSPTDDEVAAIIAAIEMVWPKPVAAARRARPAVSTAWRYSGRWWSEGRLPSGWT